MSWLFPHLPQSGYVLASASPRRAQILAMLGVDYQQQPTNVEENRVRTRPPLQHVEELAGLKAVDCLERHHEGIIIAADTIVVVDEDVLEKPASDTEALEMLQRLRDQWHTVMTGLALVDVASRRKLSAVATTEVRFSSWDDDFLRRYVATGECRDKAGSYGIQGLGALLVAELRGCYYNVMGFPITLFMELLTKLVDSEVDRGV